jgi:hypothetical protein
MERAPMAKLHHSGTAEPTALRQAAVIRGMTRNLERTVRILSLVAEEQRTGVFDRSELNYPILARTLTARRDNLLETIAALDQRLRFIAAAISFAAAETA